MDKRILTLAGIILLIAAVIFGMRTCNRKECVKPDILVEPQGSVPTNTEVTFSCINSEDEDVLQWIYSDGSEDQFGKSVKRFLTKPGTVVVTLVRNGKNDCSDVDSIIVTEPVVDTARVALAYTIEGPSTIVAGKPNTFKAVGSGGRTFLWDFAENSEYGGKTEQVTYTYSNPGTYDIYLHVDDQKFTKKVKVLPPMPVETPGGGGSSGQVAKPGKTLFPKVPPDEILTLLNQFGLAAKNDEENQSEILDKLKLKLCRDETIPVVKTNDASFHGSFEDYYHQLQFRYKVVKTVSLEYDAKTGCATKIIITE